MPKSKLILFTGLFLVSTLIHAETSDHTIDNEGMGFGLGAIVGGLIAGPPGAIIGAAGGSIFGHKETKKDEAYATLEKQLNEKSEALSLLKNNIAILRSKLARSIRNISLENKQSAIRKLENGLSMSVYFRTNDDVIDNTLLPHINELASLIYDYPELKVQLCAYADHRGNPAYNMNLSKSRAQSVRNALIEAGISGKRISSHAHGEANAINKDHEGLIFDRRVDIQLTIDTEARSHSS